jgi:hypothetical protein
MANVGERTSLLHYGMDGNLRVNASGLCTIKLFTAVMNSVSLSPSSILGITAFSITTLRVMGLFATLCKMTLNLTVLPLW